MPLGGRKLEILKLVIDDFIDSAQPVGSRTIAKKYTLGISSATIRNEMADLEDLGYLLQPHTSAGRVPSELGYRLYVDSLMHQISLAVDQNQVIRNLLANKLIRVEDVIGQAAEMLADMTHMIAIVCLPQFKKSKLVNMKLVKLSESNVLLILVSEDGVFRNFPIELRDFSQTDLDRISDGMLNALRGATIQDISTKMIMGIKKELSEYGTAIDYLIPILRNALRDLDDIELRVDGAGYIFDLPEYGDVEKARKLLEALEDKSMLFRLFDNVSTSGITVKIGREIGMEPFADCSVIAASYRVGENNLGYFGIVGPTRLDYQRGVTIMESFRQTLGEIFSGINL